MLMSKEMKRVVRDNGYGVLAWAITKLIENGQHNVAAMIICCLCLLPRDKEVENNGVIAVLTNFKLRKAAESADTHFWIRNLSAGMFVVCHDRVTATLATCGWYANCRQPYFNRYLPMIMKDDGIWYYYPARRDHAEEEPLSVQLCDSAGAQRDQCIQEFRIIRNSHTIIQGVAIYSKQMGRYYTAEDGRRSVGNGYFEYRIPHDTVLYTFGRQYDGRRLIDVLEFDKWYDYFLNETTPPTLT
ncbi:MAG: hypothetical protein A3C85_00135 [Candidatus Doudnabacteria bacterium RIFCSPHIGHO2_02_FULL_48_21]|uniref:Uncharacterized protein n=1 Tax=Candidatus Doudnabacteria bacterium RIFCSPLOWO2_02_FULL_48_13 TaxID=1817845 RepID=A0A1F5QC07_9BACT|nr:MAG: hypothetical protein A3K05_01230 [Candidatus Doudnabacteria bacterium RIFCSPHIGHO2_01_48_18]OGE77505.1 MAG: hypothetical protein A2668_03425 [Candidatus Doudnabacteria bacterium RIFCSPHIGHO2_01_FULL_48_180]OGE91646.1 MAG: hypothetical protein A3F44_02985 [Candidatus Doudnabacteria bacterium RIFCSPHIGHO2_12_FULL_47_25]OGE93340.1 MAG: hypothetical protein A3C85_00135 [Candidatus Doudnabacteria bacterium RIFCSPHIGHO2_02_FULL_48_21]OGE97424.1 MAG: hypothetical protein A3A83_01070 [Candidatu